MLDQTTSILSEETLNGPETVVLKEPFPILIASNQLPANLAEEIDRDFPQYTGAGYLPHEEKDCGPTINTIVSEMTSREFANNLGKHLGVPNLGDYPTMVSICRSLNKKHGNIHTDSNSKIVTCLLYLNPGWLQNSEGCLRFLRRIDSFEDMVAPEIRPVYGSLAAFRRADNSFHGHLPYEGERRVIQVAWLTSEEEKLRKTKRGKMSRFLKWMTSSLGK